MSEVILHLGLAKTGTTWFQQRLFPQLDLLFHHVSHYDIINKPIKGKTLFSFEGLSGTPYNNDRFVIADRLKALFPDAQVLVMFREKESYLQSLYSQYLRGGGTGSFCWFKEYLSHVDGFLDWENYKKHLIRLWDEKNCFFPLFEDFCHNPQVFTVKLCDWMHVPVPSDVDYSPVNKSLDQVQRSRWPRINTWFRSRWTPYALLPRWCNPCCWWNQINKLQGGRFV